LTEALSLAREVEYHEQVPVLIYLGWALRELGEHEEAGRHLREAVRLARAQERLEKLSDALRELGRLELVRGEQAAGERHLRESLRAAREAGAHESTLGALQALAELARTLERFDEARVFLDEALGMEEGRDVNHAALAQLLHELGAVELGVRDFAAAVDRFAAATHHARRAGRYELTGLSLFGSARAALGMGDPTTARQLGRRSKEQLEQLASPKAAAIADWLGRWPESGDRSANSSARGESMDPLSLIVTALLAGASAGMAEVTTEGVKDAYQALVSRLRRSFAGRAQAETALVEYEKNPEVWETPLRHELARVGADKDEELVAAAQDLLARIDPEQAQAGRFNVQIDGNVQGWVQGDHASVRMTFGSDENRA